MCIPICIPVKKKTKTKQLQSPFANYLIFFFPSEVYEIPEEEVRS